MKRLMILALLTLYLFLGFVSAGFACAGNAVAHASEGEKVGNLGIPSRLAFKGNNSFTEEAIRDGISQNPKFWLAGHPSASRVDYIETIRQLTIQGYRAKGFPMVRAAALAMGKPLARYP
jgi:hypothetical protein